MSFKFFSPTILSLLVLQFLVIASQMLELPAATATAADEIHDMYTYTHEPSLNFFLLILLSTNWVINR